MKIWLDDIRPLPDGYDILAKSVNEAKQIIEELEKDKKEITEISLDHDLGDYVKDGGDGICLMDWMVERGSLYNITFHTANPVGRRNMERMKERFWKDVSI